MLEPYADNWSNFGCEMLPDGQLRELVSECCEMGLEPVLHASGNAAVRESLRAFVESKAKDGNLQPTLVHGDLLSEMDSPLLSNLDLNLVTNPRRIQSESRVGSLHWGKRWTRALDLQTWHRSGARLRFGSGEPLNHWSPLKALQAAVTSSQGDEALSIRDGLRALCWAGGCEAGAPADLVVLSRDPLEVPPEEIGGIEVMATLLEGEVVFEREGELGE
jgi:predicted amidohydrolase YtcJ